ncbi:MULTISPECIES: gluconeogenesis factor YvcK family protein [Paenibacillus]|uniref:Gluconeogenesis factor n=1 Tax=Paenibacillus naphthalenovorans TaxID=162209 RepID=A0A0U2WDC6_9BACL|nr:MULTISPECIES: YvcK family protein [Paenibacillus]ALS24382.1 gluconeogenesis factor [Paenibacillus naphthalenovorans]GCL74717.1 YvcK family protein [Paenibacillus naphthalenovorans]
MTLVHERGKIRPRIVVIGGGTGLSVMLRGLKQKPMDITAIVTVADDGGSSGILRSELEIIPPGDIRNVLTALSDVEPLLGQLLEYRFDKGNGLAGHSLGNLMLAAMRDITGDFVTGVRELSRVLAVRGRVLPASDQSIVLIAEMEDGTVVKGESKIPQAGGVIRRVSIEPADACALPEALEALRQADAILVGPGSLYTSILPNLLVPEIAETIVSSQALKMFICNVMTQPGETDDYKVSDHLKAIRDHVGQDLFDYVIVNNEEIPEKVQNRYAEKGAKVVQLDLDEVTKQGYKVIADRLVLFRTYLRHDAEKLSQHIYQLVESWMFKKR